LIPLRRELALMPNYPTHARWGRVGGVVAGLAVGGAIYALLGTAVLAAVGAAGTAVTTFVGSIYPDVDHHTSIPRRKAVRGFRALGALGVVGLAIARSDVLFEAVGSLGVSVPPVVGAAAFTSVAALLVVALVDPLLGFVTRKHRGWTHSAPINLVLVATLVAGAWLFTRGLVAPARLVAAAVTASFYLGTLVHLGLDGELP
jgi:hypothetical protein